MRKRFIAALLLAVMVLSLLPAGAMAAEDEVYAIESEDSGEEPVQRAFDAYVDKLLRAEDPELFSTGGEIARNRLTDNAKRLYDFIAPRLAGIAQNGGSTVFEAASAGVRNLGEDEATSVYNALYCDYPFESFWFDWCDITYWGTGISISASEEYRDWSVSPDRFGYYYTVDSGKAGRAYNTIKDAAANAARILRGASGLNELEKLLYYKESICCLVDYNDPAYEDDWPFGNPSQIIWVFDNDSSTDVTCAGYARAFQYLCDKGFPDGAVQCYTALGEGFGGYHQWNIVKFKGKNYLVDVTGCDGDDQVYNENTFFLAGASGSPERGYTMEVPKLYLKDDGTHFKERTYTYTYDLDSDSFMYMLWNNNVLTLAEENYPLFYDFEDTLYVGESYTWKPNAHSNFRFELISGRSWCADLPAGARLSSDGTLTYTPSAVSGESKQMVIKATYTCFNGSKASYYITLKLPKVRPASEKPVGPTVIETSGLKPQETGRAYENTQTILVDGWPVTFETYALHDSKGNPTNYIRIRDLAYTINGTDAQFEITWDGDISLNTGVPYTPNGKEMQTPFSGDRDYKKGGDIITIDGRPYTIQCFVLYGNKGGGYTYYKLRDLGMALGFNVGWDAKAGMAFIETDEPYTGK